MKNSSPVVVFKHSVEQKPVIVTEEKTIIGVSKGFYRWLNYRWLVERPGFKASNGGTITFGESYNQYTKSSKTFCVHESLINNTQPLQDLPKSKHILDLSTDIDLVKQALAEAVVEFKKSTECLLDYSTLGLESL